MTRNREQVQLEDAAQAVADWALSNEEDLLAVIRQARPYINLGLDHELTELLADWRRASEQFSKMMEQSLSR